MHGLGFYLIHIMILQWLVLWLAFLSSILNSPWSVHSPNIKVFGALFFIDFACKLAQVGYTMVAHSRSNLGVEHGPSVFVCASALANFALGAALGDDPNPTLSMLRNSFLCELAQSRRRHGVFFQGPGPIFFLLHLVGFQGFISGNR